MKTASTRGVSCSVSWPSDGADARRVRAALPHFVGDEHDQRDAQRQQVVDRAIDDERRQQLRRT